ncbi:glutamyl-tRNA reductase [Trueperella bialowiezensis]|uniref:glutamyl-tRNA reductase n=1 Tax=Trueperella bialowiezensis TaxID=312285 RepID=UPI0013DFFC8F|nr:glutamyl-tRNA reductase [Trueperella bialowiezensis]
MALFVVSANHHDLTISDVERVAQHAQNLSDTLRDTVSITGHAVLSTCNRYELYLDSTREAAEAIREQLNGATTQGGVILREAAEAARHIYAVASGLDSMVVGEREIVSQMRTALSSAREAHTTTPLLEQVLQGALATSRKVALHTDFSAAGRSIVGAALDMANSSGCERAACDDAGRSPCDDVAIPRSNWANIRVLLVGTGAYAGATVAALKDRGATHISVWSKSGRGHQFAADHGVVYTPVLDLMSPAVVILCRGTGSPVITADALREVMPRRSPLTLIDLARSRDVETTARDVEGVRLIDLEVIRHHVPAACQGDIERAQQIIADGLADLDKQLVGRAMDPVIIAIRNHLGTMLERELEKFPAGGDVPAERSTRALQRFAATLAYQHSENARRAAEGGRAEEFHAAAELVFGISLPEPQPVKGSS